MNRPLPQGVIHRLRIGSRTIEQMTIGEVNVRGLQSLCPPRIIVRERQHPGTYNGGTFAPLALRSNEVPRGAVAYVVGDHTFETHEEVPGRPDTDYDIAVQFYRRKR